MTIRKPRDPVHVRAMTERRAEQCARAPSFMVISPCLGMLPSVKTGTMVPHPAKRPLVVSDRVSLIEVRKKYGRKAWIAYLPHQGAREIARRLARA